MQPTPSEFKKIIRTYFRQKGRDLPWRNTKNPYYILVSEIMLQQTQVIRVLEKYTLFLKTFPTIARLAQASTHQVLAVWQGLGYNRRALMLHRLAKIVVEKYNGKIPKAVAALDALPGLGFATAAAICVSAFDQPLAYIETNIRTVFIHFFFGSRTDVHDREILPLVERTLDRKNPREWYFALMDYGVYLKRHMINPNRKSVHYAKQSSFKGSDRQIRGAIVRVLVSRPAIREAALQAHVKARIEAQISPQTSTRASSPVRAKARSHSQRIARILRDLEKEGFIKRRKGQVLIQ